jgi:5-methylcytosine-specific restriction endonuclease McrA
MRAVRKGQNLGKICSEETKRKISISNIGKKRGPISEEHKRRIIEANTGRRHSEESKKRMSEMRKGKKHPPMSEESKRKISLANKGKKKPPFTEEHRRKLSESRTGEKSSTWLGGKSFEPYSVDWTRTFKISIRERDKYTCYICKEKQCDETFSVHHIDYNKKNCNPSNLITLCRSCHTKTNLRRDYWIEYFKALT